MDGSSFRRRAHGRIEQLDGGIVLLCGECAIGLFEGIPGGIRDLAAQRQTGRGHEKSVT